MGDPKFGLGVGLLGGILVIALLAPAITGHGPEETELTAIRAAPSWAPGGNPSYPMGADAIGRDVWARIAFGGRYSLAVGLSATMLAALLGISLGVLAGFYGGWLDNVIMRVGDVLLAFPSILLALAVMIMLGPGIINLILVLGLSHWIHFGRVIRSEVLSIREREFIQAGVAIGARDRRLIWRYVLPNVVGSATVLATLTIARAIIAESSLSFLGLGIPPPTPSWGSMLADGRPYLAVAWWISTLPGLFLMATVIAINLLGDWLRDVLDPRLSQVRASLR
jgi:peptide/nickel transport system permease protein